MMIWFVFSLPLLTGIAQSQQLQETPKIEPKIQPENTVPPEKNPTEDFDNPVATATNARNVEPAKHAKNASNEGTEFWPSFCGYRLKITDTLVVGFTALLFAATVLLYRATRDLVKGAEDTARKQLRAYLHISVAYISKTDNVLHFEIKNFGQTPAKKIVICCDMAVGDMRWQFAKTLQQTTNVQQLEGGVIVPAAARTLMLQIPFPADAGSETQQQGNVFYFWGKINYKDAFNQAQTTEFRMIKGPEWMTNTKMVICHQGNDAT